MLQLPIYQSQPAFSQFSLMDFFSSVLAFSPLVAWSIAALVAIIFVIISSVLYYHWKRFGFERDVMKRVALIYFVVSGILLAVMVISLAVYLSSV